jgi:hypothetical protein
VILTSPFQISRHILYIHDILINTEDSQCALQLVVTKYSFLATHRAFAANTNAAISDRELIVHFNEFDHMAERIDAEVINLQDISISNEGQQFRTVRHVIQVPGKQIAVDH